MGLMSTVTRIVGAAGSRRGAPAGGRRTTGLGGGPSGGRTTGTRGTGAAGGREARAAGGLLRNFLRKR
jgi:hypothetical protein